MEHEPLFVLTSDVDWASEHCIAAFLDATAAWGVTPTVFATHHSPQLNAAARSGAVELGIHPNFLPGSSHGDDVSSVLDHVFNIVPQARGSRSHAFVDSTPITRALAARGVRYDSNLCLYLQPGLTPLRHASGLIRFPVFWEDDVHWEHSADWRFENFREVFFSPGLKVLNVHPFMFTLNIPDAASYAALKPHIPTLTGEQAATLRRSGPGPAEFMRELVREMSRRGLRFHSLAELMESDAN